MPSSEAAFHAASLVATGFSVVTTLTRTCVIASTGSRLRTAVLRIASGLGAS
jgi:Asp/Glu/hydantoin racemase